MVQKQKNYCVSGPVKFDENRKSTNLSETIDFASESSYHHFDEVLMSIGLIGDGW